MDCLAFGSECGDVSLLEKAARITAQEPEAYRGLLKEGLRDGLSFPRARQKALSLFLGDDRAGEVLAEPNNILGVEYIKAILQQKSSLGFCTIQRRESGYHDMELSDISMRDALLRAAGASGTWRPLRQPTISRRPKYQAPP